MGLDVTAYSKLQKVDAVFRRRTDVVRLRVNDDFPAMAADIEDNGCYRYSDSLGLHAGSYIGYNAWRNELAKMAGYPAVPVDRYNTGNVQMRNDQGAWNIESGPFWELITFSDCEGVIGPAVCAKLAKDFADHQAKTDAHEDERFRSKYAEWRAAFELAADGGAVDFH